ncbi:MAG: hypothetical protein KDD50_03800 [Bdellovibrionales bacterium]|nr:hypothetical protein [Bdellovibrionales bacterium]
MFKYFFRDLWLDRRFAILFVLNISFGLCGFVAIDFFKDSIDHTLKEKSKMTLGADFSLSARRPITDTEVELVQSQVKDFQKVELLEIFSMVSNDLGKSRLVQIKGIEKDFPFYGEILLNRKRGEFADLEDQATVWVYPEILSQLSVEMGEDLKIGEKVFKIAGVVKDDSAMGISTSMAPRIYVDKSQLLLTHLVRPGSIAWHSVLFKFSSVSSEKLEQIRKFVFSNVQDPDLKVDTHESASELLGRLLRYLNDFLGLTALTAIFLSLVGIYFLFRSYIRKKIKEIAIYMSLGLNFNKIVFIYLIKVMSLGILGSLFSTGVALFIVPIMIKASTGILPTSIQFIFSWRTILVAFSLGLFGSLMVSLPLLVQAKGIKIRDLLSDQNVDSLKANRYSYLFFLAGILIFWALAILQSKSYYVGSLFIGIFIFVAALLLVALNVFLKLLKQIKFPFLSYKWAIRDLIGLRWSTLVSGLSIGIGVLLLNLIPQLQTSLNTELDSPESSKLPSLFLFDIQEEQLDSLQRTIDAFHVSLTQLSPMIRARLVSVNDTPFDKGDEESEALTREEQTERRFRNRGFNLSYRSSLSDSEEIVEGVDFSSDTASDSDIAEVSVEKRFAQRLKLKINDVLEFDIQGVNVKGKIVNFRKVKWQSFQPNFFVQFQDGVLNEAPKTYIATLPNLSFERSTQLQDVIVKNLPNVSIIDVSRLVSKIKSITEQMSWALRFMALLCLFSGFMVLYSIANYQSQSRSKDIGLLKSLGSSFSLIRKSFIWQSSIVTFFSAGMGAFGSVVMSLLLSYYIFDGVWVVNWKYPAATVLLAVLLSLFIQLLATGRALRVKPNLLISNS